MSSWVIWREWDLIFTIPFGDREQNRKRNTKSPHAPLGMFCTKYRGTKKRTTDVSKGIQKLEYVIYKIGYPEVPSVRQ